MAFDKHFTLTEANALAPWVREVFGRIHRLLAAAENPAMQSAPDAAGSGNGTATRAAVAALSNGDAGEADFEAILRSLDAEQKINVARGLIAGIQGSGIVIQDVRRGLIDFPAVRADGEEIFLCYELADGAAIGAWHPIDAGYAGRRPIDGTIPR